MKELFILKSKKKSRSYLILSFAILCVFIFLFITDNANYPNGKSFYWIAIFLFGITTLKFAYDFLDKTPLYILTRRGISKGDDKDIILWTDLSTFECLNPYRKYISPKVAILYDKNGNKSLTIDFTYTDISLDRMKRILKMKLKPK